MYYVLLRKIKHKSLYPEGKNSVMILDNSLVLIVVLIELTTDCALFFFFLMVIILIALAQNEIILEVSVRFLPS